MDVGSYLLEYLHELDFCIQGAPLTFQELASWQISTGLSLSSWEVLALKRLSSEYVDQLHRSRDQNEPAPYQTDNLPRQRAAVHKFFKQLAQRRKGTNGRPRTTRRKGHLQRD